MRFSEMDRNELAYAILRFAVGGVFLWFGLDKFFNPDAWLGWVPGWMLDLVPLEDTLFMTIQGVVEFGIGVALVAGKFVRGAALLATLFLAAISFLIGANEVTVRDVGLLGAALALLVMADGGAKRPIGRKRLAVAASLFVLAVFVMGVLFLRS